MELALARKDHQEELADEKQSGIVPLIDNKTVKVIPIALKKDGMAIKPGMTVDSRQGLIIGTTEKIDHKYIKENPNPDPEQLKNIFVKEAECYCVTTVDRKISLPIGVDYINGSLNAKDTCECIEKKAIITQTCLNHIKSSNCKSGVLHAESCSSICNDCLEEGTVCTTCVEMGHMYIEPALRACDFCLLMNKKCVKAATIIFLMDSESRNGKAQSLFESNLVPRLPLFAIFKMADASSGTLANAGHVRPTNRGCRVQGASKILVKTGRKTLDRITNIINDEESQCGD